MGNSFGRQVLGQVGTSIQLSADGKPEMKPGGVTADWATVAAHSGADLELEDGIIIKDGEKYLRYGQPLCKITTAEVQTIDLSGGDDPSGGTWPLTVPGYGTALGLAWNISAAALQAAIEALSVNLVDKVTVAKTGFVYTVTFSPDLGNIGTMTVSTADLTGGTITVNVATTTHGSASGGMYGPADTTASDGRQTLTRGQVFLVNETVKESDLKSNHPPVLDGGRVWRDRILAGGTNQPTLANLIAAMPRLSFAE